MPKNGKLTAVIASSLGALMVAGILGSFEACERTKANAQDIEHNDKRCAEHRVATKDMPVKVAVIETTVTNIEKKLDAFLKANGVEVSD